MSIDHLIFDFDGTISNSYPLFLGFVHEYAEKNRLPLSMTDAELFYALNITMKDAFEKLGWESFVSYDAFIDDFHQKQIDHALEFRPFPEAIALLEYAKSIGKKNYIYTHTGPIVSEILKNMGILHLFEFVLDDSYGFPAKPCPDALNFLAQRLSLDPATCMMIGDRPIDAHAGMNAGMIGCLWDAYGFFGDVKVDHRVTSLAQIKQFI
ncbi:MAG: HAD-IA family hydrolase [Clostridia bacterium]|nr:HAD-IA family hydrolase [Clostridia bacterium]